MQYTPKVSVLMPLYHTPTTYVREAIESILNQTFTDFEFLILNNSPEDTRLDEIVASYNDERIRYVKAEKNLGISGGRNKLIEMAKGAYLAVMDHDDISLPDRLKEEVSFLEAHPEVGVIGSQYLIIPKKRKSSLATNNDQIVRHLMTGCALLHPSCMIRTSVLHDNHLMYEEAFSPAEDYALYVRFIGKTKFYNIPKILFHYRWHATNTSKTHQDQMKASRQKVQALARSLHPDIWQDVIENAPHLVRLKLFGFLPIAKLTKKGSACPTFLRYLPFIKASIKQKIS